MRIKASEEKFNTLKKENDYQWSKLIESEKKLKDL